MQITAAAVEEACRLGATGLFDARQIAEALGISATSVRSILRGRYDHLADDRWTQELVPFDAETGAPRRCPGCGARVHLPCHRCFLARLAELGLRFPTVERFRRGA